MAADLKLESYNKVAQALLIPFDESEISERKGSDNKTYSYVPPERYRYKLLQVFTNGFQFHVTDAKPGPTGISGQAYFVGEIPEENVRYDISCPCFEPWTISTTTNKPFAPEQSFQKLISAGLKAVCREMGLGLHLYDKAARKITPAAAPAAANKPAVAAGPAPIGSGDGIPNFDPEWDGSKVITFGKHKDHSWNDTAEVDDGYLQFFVDKAAEEDKPARPEVLKEIARRQSVAGSTGASQATAAMAAKATTVADDTDFNF